MDEENTLRWRWGAGNDEEDAGDRICLDCGALVWAFKEGYICSGCKKQAD